MSLNAQTRHCAQVVIILFRHFESCEAMCRTLRVWSVRHDALHFWTLSSAQLARVRTHFARLVTRNIKCLKYGGLRFGTHLSPGSGKSVNHAVAAVDSKRFAFFLTVLTTFIFSQNTLQTRDEKRSSCLARLKSWQRILNKSSPWTLPKLIKVVNQYELIELVFLSSVNKLVCGSAHACVCVCVWHSLSGLSSHRRGHRVN